MLVVAVTLNRISWMNFVVQFKITYVTGTVVVTIIDVGTTVVVVKVT